jgi:hypothetical protein
VRRRISIDWAPSLLCRKKRDSSQRIVTIDDVMFQRRRDETGVAERGDRASP